MLEAETADVEERLGQRGRTHVGAMPYIEARSSTSEAEKEGYEIMFAFLID
jgi:hypothetical protein